MGSDCPPKHPCGHATDWPEKGDPLHYLQFFQYSSRAILILGLYMDLKLSAALNVGEQKALDKKFRTRSRAETFFVRNVSKLMYTILKCF